MANIILTNSGGTTQTFTNINSVVFNTTDGSTAIFTEGSGSTSIYKIYDSSSNEIPMSNWTISGLADAYYYTKNGGSMQRVGGRIFHINANIAEGTGDKFYVYDNTNGLQTDKYRGYYGTSCGCTNYVIGGGKINTTTIFSKGIPTDYTPNIWQWAQTCRTNLVGGCDDWYIGSEAENDQLRLSGLVNWFDSGYIWASVEHAFDKGNQAQYWSYPYNCWHHYGKNDNFGLCVCMRSF